MGPVFVRILFLIVHSFQPMAPATLDSELKDPRQMMISTECFPQPQMYCHLTNSPGSDIFYQEVINTKI